MTETPSGVSDNQPEAQTMIKQPTATVHFSVGKIRLRIDAHARAIYTSNRSDAKIQSIVWNEINTGLALDSEAVPGYLIPPVAIDTGYEWDRDELANLQEAIRSVAIALGSEDYAERIMSAIREARAIVAGQNH